jgi:hypothetical protein
VNARLALLAPALSVAVLGCSPVGTVIRPPQFELKEAGLERFDPPGLETPARAVIHLEIEGRNPNPFGGRVEEVAFDLVLDGQKAATAGTPGFSLPAGGAPSRIEVDVEVPVAGSTVSNLLKIARGEAVSYRLDGSFRLDAGPLGRPRFGPYTFAQGTYRAPAGPPQRPSFAWRSDLTRLTVGVGGLVLDLGFEVTNPGNLGYRLVAPLALLAGDQTVARTEAGGTVPARGKGVIYTRFQVDPLTAARSVVSGRFDFSVSGAPTLEVPGLQAYAFPVSVLFSGSARR